MQLRKATRKKAKIRLGLSAVSGGGKTYSALLIAYGITKNWDKIAVIDSENYSADLYAHLGDFNVLNLSAPFTPEKYIEAIQTCEKGGIEVIIIDSITHEWDGKGGCLEIVDQLGGKYQDWAKVTPRHQAFISTITQSPAHIITTVRRKQDYEMTKDNSSGKIKVEKAGLKEITREGFEYELTANLELDIRHNATASKDRTGLFMGKPEFIPSIETGEKILAWCESGVDQSKFEKEQEELRKAELEKLIKDGVEQMRKAESVESMTEIKNALPSEVRLDPRFKEETIKIYNNLQLKTWENRVKSIDTRTGLVELYNNHKDEIDKNPKLQGIIANRRNEINTTNTTNATNSTNSEKPEEKKEEQVKEEQKPEEQAKEIAKEEKGKGKKKPEEPKNPEETTEFNHKKVGSLPVISNQSFKELVEAVDRGEVEKASEALAKYSLSEPQKNLLTTAVDRAIAAETNN